MLVLSKKTSVKSKSGGIQTFYMFFWEINSIKNNRLGGNKMKKNKKMTPEQRLVHLPNPMHLDACKQGGNIYKDKTKYTRKGKSRFDYRKENF